MMNIQWCCSGARCTGHLRAPPHRYPLHRGRGLWALDGLFSEQTTRGSGGKGPPIFPLFSTLTWKLYLLLDLRGEPRASEKATHPEECGDNTHPGMTHASLHEGDSPHHNHAHATDSPDPPREARSGSCVAGGTQRNQ